MGVPLTELGNVHPEGGRDCKRWSPALLCGVSRSPLSPAQLGRDLPAPLVCQNQRCKCLLQPDVVPEEGRADRTHVRFCQQGPLVRPAQAHHQKPRAEQVGR